ncbi:MAG: Uma2 family endonuclease [Persephonella sp.]|nr:MAG: Uma2 family endonuclease [Persephonella sp.]RUM58859.1 MAG: Uma2 family endonuclease [Persephonella sp.]
MATITENKTTKKKKKGRPKIPDYLVYEILDNKKIYYKNYRKVLSGELPSEAIMGSSDLQAWIIDTIVRFLHRFLDYKKYKLLYNEVGYFYTPSRSKKWLNLDIAIVSREKLKKPQGTYLKIPPEVVIEVDTKADLSKIGSQYYFLKTDRLLKSGVKKVIWIFTEYKKIQIAEDKKPWLTVDYNYEFEIIDGININLDKLLKEED